MKKRLMMGLAAMAFVWAVQAQAAERWNDITKEELNAIKAKY